MRLIAAMILTVMVSPVFADDVRRAGDVLLRAQSANVYSELCLAALDGTNQLHRKAQEAGIPEHRLSDIQCNGVSINAFADRYATERNLTAINYRLVKKL
ncbi:MAG: hypothetical protein U5O39_16945 [Gammaproteobacteria bacterium]|nr:hypothetical protein [Gammaproteobacteria bacterium]